MKTTEYQDLQKFGVNIEKITDETIKKDSKKNNLKYLLKRFFKKFFTLICSITKWIIIKIKSYFIKIKNWLILKRNLKIIKKNFSTNANKKVYSYKIVESKKQRGNKTIITRKRVPFNFDINNYRSDMSNIDGMFYLSKKNTHTGDTDQNLLVKKSIWDFAIEDDKI